VQNATSLVGEKEAEHEISKWHTKLGRWTLRDTPMEDMEDKKRNQTIKTSNKNLLITDVKNVTTI